MSPSSRPRLTTIVADDDAAVREALTVLLGLEPDIEVVGSARDGDEAVALAERSRAVLVVADVRMPQGGPALVRRLRALPSPPVVVGVSANADTATWTAMLAAGANGYLLKDSLGEDLCLLLRRCVRDEVVVAVPGAGAVLRRLLAQA